MATTILSLDAIISDPKICDGYPKIAGTDIGVFEIVASHKHHKTAYAIARQYNLGLDEVYAALAFYYLHKDAIDKELQQRPEAQEQLNKLVRQGKLIRFDTLGVAKQSSSSEIC